VSKERSRSCLPMNVRSNFYVRGGKKKLASPGIREKRCSFVGSSFSIKKDAVFSVAAGEGKRGRGRSAPFYAEKEKGGMPDTLVSAEPGAGVYLNNSDQRKEGGTACGFSRREKKGLASSCLV